MRTNKYQNNCASSLVRKDVTMEGEVMRLCTFIRYCEENINEVNDGVVGGCRVNCTWKSKQIREKEILPKLYGKRVGRESSVGRATRYGLDGPRNESRWGRDFPHSPGPVVGPTQPPIQWVPGLSRG